MDIGGLIDIKSLINIKSFIEVNSFIEQKELKSYSANLRILVLSYIFILGFKLQPDLIALHVSLGPEIFLPFNS